MTIYLNAGVVRTQEYIARTSGADDGQLRRRRGASQMITDATAAATFNPLGWQANHETYHVEGTVHLRRPGPQNPGTDISALTAQVLTCLREALPMAHLEASWAVGATYSDVIQDLRDARAGVGTPPEAWPANRGVLVWIPQVREDPFALRCNACGLGVVMDDPEESGDPTLCRDCIERNNKGRRAHSKSGGVQAPALATPAKRSLEAVSALVGQDLAPAQDLTALSQLPTAHLAKHNHLATIYADGNSIGTLFDRLRPELAQSMSIALDTAITTAGHEAVAAIQRHSRPGTLAAEVTTLAADDAVITVPACLGWPFVLELVQAFNDSMTRWGLENPGEVENLPSLTAGIVFSHVKHPIEDAITAAFEVLRGAKSAVSGKTSAISWADLTESGRSDNRRDVATTRARTTPWFTDHRHLIEACAVLPNHQQHKWIRDITTARAANPPLSDETIVNHLTREARRLGIDLPDLHRDDQTSALTDVIAAMSIARWWTSLDEQGQSAETDPDQGGTR